MLVSMSEFKIHIFITTGSASRVQFVTFQMIIIKQQSQTIQNQ